MSIERVAVGFEEYNSDAVASAVFDSSVYQGVVRYNISVLSSIDISNGQLRQ